ncbi:MAG: trypsin-like peptidase domain-containing protein [Actinomycetota bacterium]|nr:trypsin-like peptidase domain-containing protein [Actinomycetota bacterium]
MRDGRAATELRSDPVPADGPTAPAPPRRRGGRRQWLALAAAVLVGMAVVLVAAWPQPGRGPSESEVNGIVDRKVGAAIAELQGQPPPSVTVYDAIRLPLVAIRSERARGTGGPALGSGVIVNTRGDILTSLHVVEGAAAINVSFSDGTESPASVSASDPDHDIAVLRPARLPEVVVPAVLGGGAQVGDEAFAVGHPLGLVGSLSAGVISGLDRSFPLSNGRTITGMIQFDAAVNPGNSGGPLLNRNGEVIGIVTGLANPSGDGFIGIGFAVPIGTAGGAAGAPAR